MSQMSTLIQLYFVSVMTQNEGRKTGIVFKTKVKVKKYTKKKLSRTQTIERLRFVSIKVILSPKTNRENW